MKDYRGLRCTLQCGYLDKDTHKCRKYDRVVSKMLLRCVECIAG